MNLTTVRADLANTDYYSSTLFPEESKSLAAFFAKGATLFLVLFLAMSTFEGALRFYTVQAGLPWLIYLKDVFLFCAFCLGAVQVFRARTELFPLMVVTLFLVVGTVVGLYILNDIRQPLFGAKTWLSLLCGTAIATSVDFQSKFLQRSLFLFWLCAVGGIVLTWQWRPPWLGFVYDIGGISLEGSREWSLGQAQRVPGFTRASFDAALQCLFFGTMVVMATRSGLLRLCVWLISLGAGYLTLSRSGIVALALAVSIYYLTTLSKTAQRFAKLTVVGLAIGVAVLPFAARAYYKNKAGGEDASNVASMSSFEERAVKTWPNGFALASSRGGNWITGRGIGGIGAAQQYFEESVFNPGDNLFVYLWGAFGAFSGVFLAFVAFQVGRATVPLTAIRQAGMVVVGAFLGVGLTLNGIEGPISGLFFGMGLVWLTTDNRARTDGSPA
jgi:hypothetical protein